MQTASNAVYDRIARPVFLAAVLLVIPIVPLFAQPCGVGTRVQGDMGGGQVATIAEIGEQPPHIGWYRLVFDWNAPNGDWYDPASWTINIAGTTTRCGQAATASDEHPPGDQPAEETPTAPAPEAVDCPANEPPGTVSKSARASAQLFQRVIYEREAARVNPEGISAPLRIGLTFLAFEMGEAYKNTLTSSRPGDKRLYDGAPVDATIYPIKTTVLQCEWYSQSVRRSVTENTHNCFKDRFGDWTCPGHTTRFVESRLIPLN